jgi:hypothetical protein
VTVNPVLVTFVGVTVVPPIATVGAVFPSETKFVPLTVRVEPPHIGVAVAEVIVGAKVTRQRTAKPLARDDDPLPGAESDESPKNSMRELPSVDVSNCEDQ